jgi:hypothetical protein
MNRARIAALSLSAMSLLAGCTIEAGMAPQPYGMAVAAPPPEPIVEGRPLARNPEAMWIPGYWHWTGIQYAWIPGHWEVGPPGARWRRPRYSVREGVYFYEPGAWTRGP